MGRRYVVVEGGGVLKVLKYIVMRDACIVHF